MQKTAYAMRISDWSSDVCSSDLAFGFSSAGVFMVGESWLTSTAPREGRGKVLGLYMILNKGAFGIGQLLLLVGDPSGDRQCGRASCRDRVCQSVWIWVVAG